MKGLRIETCHNLFNTIISNDFIDYYMPQANGDFVKVYLYILRCLASTQLDISISSIADALNLTEADIIRALNYWQEQQIISIQSIDINQHSIKLLLPQKPNNSHELKDSTQKNIFELTFDEPNYSNQKPNYSPSEITKISNEQTSLKQLFYITEKYIGKKLSHSDLSILVSLNDWLKLPFDVIEFLIEYCVSNNHKSMRYIEKVAISWVEEGITTLDAAKQNIQVFNKKYFAIMKSLGLNNRNPTSSEIKYMKKWLNDFGFELNIIQEACSRTIKHIHQPSFKYVDSILSSWYRQNVKKIEDVHNIDIVFTNSKNLKRNISPTKRPTNKFINYDQREYDFEELERKARERLIKQVNE